MFALLKLFVALGQPLLRRHQSSMADAAKSGPALLPAVTLQVACVTLAGLAVSLAALCVILLIRDCRRGGRPGGLRQAPPAAAGGFLFG